jgi:hypothetical protein
MVVCIDSEVTGGYYLQYAKHPSELQHIQASKNNTLIYHESKLANPHKNNMLQNIGQILIAATPN